MDTASPDARRIDHLVLPVASLAAARARHAALGFTVAPDGVHPFGTRNACVYLADGVFLEPLAVGDAAACEAAAQAGNVFVARDRAFRRGVAPEGCSALVLASDDAAADHGRLVREGVSAGPMLAFSRPFVDAAGHGGTASFRLAFATLAGAPESFVFSCQRLAAPKVDRAGLSSHPNGATGLAGVTMVADDPAGTARSFALAAGVAAAPDGSVPLRGARVDISDPGLFTRRFGPPPPYRGCGFALVAFTVRDLAAARALLAASGVSHRDAEGALLVPRAEGQGVDFLFVEAS